MAVIPGCTLTVTHLSNVWSDFFSQRLTSVYMCVVGVGICLYECGYPLSLEEGIRSPGVTGHCGLPVIDVGNQTHMFG